MVFCNENRKRYILTEKKRAIYCTFSVLFVSLHCKNKTITLERAQRWGQHFKFCKSNYEDFEFCKADFS